MLNIHCRLNRLMQKTVETDSCNIFVTSNTHICSLMCKQWTYCSSTSAEWLPAKSRCSKYSLVSLCWLRCDQPALWHMLIKRNSSFSGEIGILIGGKLPKVWKCFPPNKAKCLLFLILEISSLRSLSHHQHCKQSICVTDLRLMNRAREDVT